jgi:TonB family protein
VQAPDDLPADTAPLLEVAINALGAVTDVLIIEPVRPDVDALVLQAAREMRFVAAERAGQPIAVRVRFRFRLRPSTAAQTNTTTQDAGVTADAAVPNAQSTQTQSTAENTGSGESTSADAAGSQDASEEPATIQRPQRRRREDQEQTVTVRAVRPEPGAATRMTFRAEELTTVPGTFGEPTRVVATLPGVARTPFGLGFFVVRGASFENTGFFIDGYPVLIMYHLAAGPAVINSRLVGQLDFYPGGYPLQYGRFSAGVISLETAAPPADRPRAELEIDIFRASGLAVLPFGNGKGSITLAARRSYYDLMLPLVSPGVAVNFADGQIRADYRFTDRLRASLFAFASSDFFDRTQATGLGATASTTRDGLRYNFGRAIARLEYRSAAVTAQWSAMLGYDQTAIQQSTPGRPDIGLDAHGATFGTRASVRVTQGASTTSVGIDAIGYDYTADINYSSPPGFAAVPPPQANSIVVKLSNGVAQLGVAGWIEQVVRAGPAELTAGTRVELMAYQGNRFVTIDPRMVARARVHERVNVVGSTGLFHQPPPVFAIIPNVGSPDLLPQRAWQSSVGTELTLPAHFEVRLTGFFNRFWQLPRASYEFVEAQGSQGAMRARALSDGEGRAYGMEFQLRRQISSGIYGWLSYTLSRSERFIGEGRVVPFTYDQTHILNFALSWEVHPRLRLGAKFQLATGSPTSLVNCNPTCGVYDADVDGYRPQYIAEADRLPTFHQLDVRADYNFMLGPLKMAAFVDVINSYYARTAEGWIYQFNYVDRRPRPGLPILPTIGIRGEL